MFPCAYLRVFQPLEAFPADERAHWERYILGGGRTPPVRPVYRERSTVPEGRIGLLSSAEGDHADVRMIEGSYYVCPWRTRLRELASLLSLRESTAPEMVDAFVPESEARRAARELARLRRRGPAAVPFLLQSPWHVPIRWFVLVSDEERRLVEDDLVGYRMTYPTQVTKARKRAEAALVALRRSELSPLADLAGDLSRWLAAFDHRSILELDYDGVSSLFTWDELDNDHSARDVQESISALGGGDLARAAELYQSVSNRWAEVRSHESLN
ncbi:MAG TPA: hypothetical protein VGB19_05430 [Actinomycetota bacterium]